MQTSLLHHSISPVQDPTTLCDSTTWRSGTSKCCHPSYTLECWRIVSLTVPSQGSPHSLFPRILCERPHKHNCEEISFTPHGNIHNREAQVTGRHFHNRLFNHGGPLRCGEVLHKGRCRIQLRLELVVPANLLTFSTKVLKWSAWTSRCAHNNGCRLPHQAITSPKSRGRVRVPRVGSSWLMEAQLVDDTGQTPWPTPRPGDTRRNYAASRRSGRH